MKKNKVFRIIGVLSLFFVYSCQDMDTPELGDYPKDSNPVGGPLKFFVDFNLNSTDPLRWGVDNIRAKFPTINDFTLTEGVNGKAAQGVKDKFINYAKPNDWCSTVNGGFTISFWEKHNGKTINGTNPGAEDVFGIASSNGHWSGATAFLLFDQYDASHPTYAAIKMVVVDKDGKDNWFTWEGANSIDGLLDNQWHHCVLVYDASTSKMTFYKDGVANPVVKEWNGHGNIQFDDSMVTKFRLGNGPQDQNDTGDNWLGSNWKGSLDQFRLYNVSLTEAEVKDLYTSKK